MHKYLRAIGFSEFERKSQIDDLFQKNLIDKNLVSTYMSLDMRICGQYHIPVCDSAGIAVIAEQESNIPVSVDFYYPFLKGYDYTTIQECTIERHSDKESYAGIIDDYRMGIALIFYITNGNVYNSLLKTHKITDIKIDKIFLSALSISGRIILPINKKASDFNDEIDEYEEDDDDFDNGMAERLINEMGDYQDGLGTKAISIGIGIKLPKGQVSNQESRLKNEDLYSIVESSLVPYGIECDKYQIMANILSVNKKQNVLTGETLYEMRVDTMGLQFNLMINEKDLDGEPQVGRRFRGVVWLLGEVEFLTRVENKDQSV